jgi:hypothetical protein
MSFYLPCVCECGGRGEVAYILMCLGVSVLTSPLLYHLNSIKASTTLYMENFCLKSC